MTTWRLRLDNGTPTHHDVLVEAAGDTRFAELREALAGLGFRGTSATLHGRVVTADATLQDLGLVHGDTLGLAGDPEPPAPRQPGRFVVAVSGPLAGAWWPLPVGGDLKVGRRERTDVRVNDPLVSGHHCTISHAGDVGVTVTDEGSSNGTYLEGERLTEPRTLSVGAYVQVGSTILTVLDISAADLPVEARPERAARPFQRHYRPAMEPLPERIDPPVEPGDPSSGFSRSWWQYLLPLASGAGMALVTGRWQFLLIIAIAPIAMLVQYLRRKRKQDEEQAEAEAAYAEERRQHEAEVAATRSIEQHRRRRAAVVGGEAVLMAELRHRRLWERGVGDDDHGEVCVGLATQPSRVETTGEEGVVEDLWAVPLSVSLPTTGALLVQGEVARARGVGRSMLLNLATTHSPMELQLSVITTEEQQRDWNWVRWLPHAFASGGATRVYTSVDQRDQAVTAIMQQIEAREEAETTLPVQVVLIDGAANVPTGRLTSMLTRGAGVGVYCIVLDDRITPEGVQGTLRLGEQPDEGSFTSRDRAPVDGILTAELTAGWADRAARSMAGLRPASDDEGGSTAAEIHLTDLLADGDLDADWITRRWQASPVQQVTVGRAGRSTLSMDIVRHGPHAIVGGATRSGKTEFLLTWLTSMCLHNDVDDLAIIIADFKGGVDHVQTARLPHTVSLVTNQDIRAFERTLVMLEAEIERRQDVLATAGTSNIEAYRSARQRDDSLVAVPRLLVVVDEFSELRQTDKEAGSGYMQRLESVARVGAGLGVHLVLVTQNFSGGQLSDQIDGQVGLGVCFRVEKKEHSKVVLRSSVAVNVPASRPGRAWARLRGLDLVEFQSARVAGRRRDLQSSEQDVRVELVPFGALATAAVSAGPSDVPHDETDLAVLIEETTRAAAGRRPPVPWPPELSPSLRLADVLDRASNRASEPGATPIGVADVPEQQAQEPVELGQTDEQVVVLGSSSRDTGTFLLTIGVADALTSPPADRHLYAIDLEGSVLSPLAELPHTGAVASLDDDRAIRILRRLTDEVGQRRAMFENAGATDLDGYERTGATVTRIRLLVNGADRLSASSEGNASPLLRPLASLVADAPGTGVEIVLGGGPSLVSKKMADRATRRFVLSLNDRSAYPIVGVRRDRAVDLKAPGRAWDVTRDRLVQLGGVGGPDAPDTEVVAELAEPLREAWGEEGAPSPMPEVRWPLAWSRLDPASIVVPRGFGHAIPVGVDTDTARWCWIDAEEDGPVVGVGGSGRSGRSAALVAIARLAASLGWGVQAVAPTKRAGAHALAADGHTVVTDPSGLVPAATRPTVFVVDDINRIDDGDGLVKVIEDSNAPMLLVLTGPIDAFGRRTGALRGLPDVRTSITLAPSVTTAVGGGRIPDDLRGEPRAGRGVVWLSGEFSGLQVPLPDDM